jgi:hypothetical protein
MSTETTNVQATGGYGYADDNVKQNPFVFGLNAGVTNLIKFEWIPNGGKDGAEQEALDIVFKINGVEKSYRMFPVVKAFGKNNEEITDPNAPEFKDALTDFNARVTHILHAFLDSDSIKAGFARPISSFKDFCQIAMSMLPKNYKEVTLDIFLQYEWQLRPEQEKTYLTIPNKMKYGRWLAPAQPGTWTEKRVENPADSVLKALWYENEKGDIHPFVKNGWFMNSNFATQQKTGSSSSDNTANQAASQQIQSDGAAKASTW